MTWANCDWWDIWYEHITIYSLLNRFGSITTKFQVCLMCRSNNTFFTPNINKVNWVVRISLSTCRRSRSRCSTTSGGWRRCCCCPTQVSIIFKSWRLDRTWCSGWCIQWCIWVRTWCVTSTLGCCIIKVAIINTWIEDCARSTSTVWTNLTK